jgi:hypothetical protein
VAAAGVPQALNSMLMIARIAMVYQNVFLISDSPYLCFI